MAVDLSGNKRTFLSLVEELTRSDSSTCQAATDGFAWREPQHPKPLNDTDVGLIADVERDLARILARALVQQFRADVVLAAESGRPER